MIEQLQHALNAGDNHQAQVLIAKISEQQASPQTQVPLVNLCLKHGFFDLGVQCFAKAAKDDHIALQLLPLLKEPLLANNPDLAYAFIDAAISTQADNLSFILSVADCLLGQQNLIVVERFLRQILQNSVHNEILARLSEVYFRQNQLHEAKACAQMALELSPENPQSYINLAVLEKALQNLPESARLYSKVLELDENNFFAHINLAQLCLMSGEFELGWLENEWRWYDSNCHSESLPLPLWQGQQETDHHILIWADQGLGDQIMYLSLLDRLSARFTVKLDPRLMDLLPQSINHLPIDYSGDYSEFDSHISLGSLPRYFVKGFEDFNPKPAFLNVSANGKNTLIDSNKKVIGFSWRGGSFGTGGGLRSLPLEQWQTLFSQFPATDYQWLNVQYDSTAEEKQWLQEHGVETPEIDLKNDLTALSDVLSQLNYYIGIDNSTVHLAGALGVPSVLLLTPVADWRWFTEEHYCYWYQSVKLLRALSSHQQDNPQWVDQVIECIKRDV